MNHTDALILAAGESKRMGTLKQLLIWKGETLLNRTLRVAREAGVHRLWVVLGAEEQRVKKSLPKSTGEIALETISNPHFRLGMGSSIQKGMRAILNATNPPKNLFLLLCDQPALQPEILRSLQEEATRLHQPLAACKYAGTCGPPLFLTAPLFPLWGETELEKGAKSTLLQQQDHCAFIHWPEGAWDLDTPEDLVRFEK